jgi:hypothetical protein
MRGPLAAGCVIGWFSGEHPVRNGREWDGVGPVGGFERF